MCVLGAGHFWGVGEELWVGKSFNFMYCDYFSMNITACRTHPHYYSCILLVVIFIYITFMNILSLMFVL